MSGQVLVRCGVSLLIAGVVMWVFWDRSDTGNPDRYAPPIDPLYLPILTAILLPLSFVMQGLRRSLLETVPLFLGVFVQIGVFDVLLMAFLPLLRKKFTARAVATLWLVPNYLYLTVYTYMNWEHPLWVLTTEFAVLKWMGIVWAIGFAAVFGHAVAEHLWFRRHLLADAQPVTDEAVLAQWQALQQEMGLPKKKIRPVLLTSDRVASPLSIGLTRWTLRVVLPQERCTAYTAEERELIFRHELVHICRGDAASKLFLSFSTAMCWFNPLLWRAMRRCAEDLELCCDEYVLAGQTEADRTRYAELVLSTAGDERGFTTCLSTDAKALRYRLKNIVQPGKKWGGALLIGGTLFLLLMTDNLVSVACRAGTMQAAVFGGDVPTVESAFVWETQANWGTSYMVTDQAALWDYLGSRELYQVTGRYDYEEHPRISLNCHTAGGEAYGLYLQEKSISVTPLQGKYTQINYYLKTPIDWELVNSLLEPMPDVEWTVPDPPELRLHWMTPELWDVEVLARAEVVSKLLNGEEQELPEHPNAQCDGVIEWNEAVGQDGALELIFPWVPDTCDVHVKYANGLDEYGIPDLQDLGFCLSLVPQSDIYVTVDATFTGHSNTEGTTEYRVRYTFTVTVPKEFETQYRDSLPPPAGE